MEIYGFVFPVLLWISVLHVYGAKYKHWLFVLPGLINEQILIKKTAQQSSSIPAGGFTLSRTLVGLYLQLMQVKVTAAVKAFL